MYSSGIRHVHKVSIPVISVGNITLGGTGKTPFTIFLADYFRDTGRKSVILTRGYGDDEHIMLKDTLPEVPVVVGRDRVKNALSVSNEETDIVILDDGYQHRRLARDLNILLLDCPRPFGNGFLCPRGVLREPVSSLMRADMIVLTKSDRVEPEEREDIIRKIKGLRPGIPVVVSRHSPVFVTDVTGAMYSVEHISGRKVSLVSGIADPGYFAYTVKKAGGIVMDEFAFRDHYRYMQQDIDRIFAKCFSARVDMILMTEKDYVKVRNLDLSRIEEKLYIFHVRMEIIEGKERLIAGLNSVISG